MPRHPYTKDKPQLVFDHAGGGLVAYLTRTARYKRGTGYTTREHVATIAYSNDLLGITDGDGPWFVMRNAFDELRRFPTRDDAIAYIKSIVALEFEPD